MVQAIAGISLEPLAEDKAGIIVVSGQKSPIVIKRAEFPGAIVIGVIGGEIHDDLDAILVGRRDKSVERSPSVAGVAKAFLDSLEVPGLVAMIRGRRIAVPVWNVQIQIVDWRRNPDGSYSHSLEIRHLLLNAG